MLDDITSFPCGRPPTPPRRWSAEQYVESLHPVAGAGRIGGLTRQNERVMAHTWRRGDIDIALPALIEQEAYVSLNRYHGPRGGGRQLAALNALWLDLDTYRVPALALLRREEIAERIQATICHAQLPFPSFLVDSGRGYYCIWLIDNVVPAALPRWREAMRALTGWAKPLGADPSCVDAARVLRLPESWHEETGRQVAIIDGDGRRHDFDTLADRIWRATGRPDRKTLQSRKKQKAGPTASASPRNAEVGRPSGLPRPARWQMIRRDLEVLVRAWGGTVPVGLRDVWLHAYACALAWTDSAADLLGTVLERARTVAPGLAASDVRRTMGTTLRRAVSAAKGRRTAEGRDPRYDYSGGRLAELLDIDRVHAERLGLAQIIPPDLRAARARGRRTERRRAAGALPRPIWLALNPISRERPWEAEGISRATWYRRRRDERARRVRAQVAALLAGATAAAAAHETGPVPPYKGEAPPSAAAHRPEVQEPERTASRPSLTGETHPLPPRRRTPPPPAGPRRGISDAPAGAPPPDPTGTAPTRQEIPMAALPFDTAVIAAAAQRLPDGDLGALTRIALALADGPARYLDLAGRAKLHPSDIDRLSDWLRLDEDKTTVLGLAVPIPGRRRAGPRQGLLDLDLPQPPEPAGGRNPESVRAATIRAGIRVLGRAGIAEAPARGFLASLMQGPEIGPVADAIDALERRDDDIADPRAWIKGYIRRRYPAGQAAKANTRTYPSGAPATPVPAARGMNNPIATPKFLGISDGKAAEIRERNARLVFPWTTEANAAD